MVFLCERSIKKCLCRFSGKTFGENVDAKLINKTPIHVRLFKSISRFSSINLAKFLQGNERAFSTIFSIFERIAFLLS